MIIKAEVTIGEMQSLADVSSEAPLEVLHRIMLNRKGIRFEDDGKLSLLTNKNPMPLGNLSWFTDLKTLTIFYTQKISE